MLWSTCYRIKADVFYLPDDRRFENKVIWHRQRKLEISDFKASALKRRNTTAIASTFRDQYYGKPLSPDKYRLVTETYCDCHLSYFKPTEYDSIVLAPEQVHLDISELYARILVSRIANEVTNFNDLHSRHENIAKKCGAIC